MDTSRTIETLAALAQTTRIDAFRLLVGREPEGLPAGEIARLLDVPQNTMSSHLAILGRAGLVLSERRSRSVIYRADLRGIGDLVRFLLKDCCGGNPAACGGLASLVSFPSFPGDAPVTRQTPFNVLFLCTGNSARSILAESILRKDGDGRFRAFSAGSQPRGEVNPMALEVLAEAGYPVDGMRSKSWDEFAPEGAPEMDFVFTVCDQAAGESCPVWPGHPVTGHWGIEDPSVESRGEIWKRAAFARAFGFMKNRIAAFTALPVESLERSALTARIRAIGHLDGASSPRSDVA